MIAYVIESGIPIPAPAGQANNAKREARTALGQALRALEVGQSFVVQTPEEIRQLRGTWSSLTPRAYRSRKVARVGWRIWRIA